MEQAGRVWAPRPPRPQARPHQTRHSRPGPRLRQTLGGSGVRRHRLAAEPQRPCRALDGGGGASVLQARARGREAADALTPSVKVRVLGRRSPGPGRGWRMRGRHSDC